MKKMTKFTELGLDKSLLDVIEKLGYSTPFPIQERAIPVLLEENDVIGQAHTGTGKTAAYALPMLQLTIPKQGIQGVIMAPTRELAIQITGEINKFSRNTGIKTATIYGGQSMGIQFDALRKKPEIIVATPGRLIDHLKRGTIKLNNVKHVEETSKEANIIFSDNSSLTANFVINCAGGNSLDVAKKFRLLKGYSDLHFRGEYWVADSDIANLVKTNIYTVPRYPEFPFLDPHWIKRANGETEIGPNAVPVDSPEAYDSFITDIPTALSKIMDIVTGSTKKLLLNTDFISLVSKEFLSSISKSAMVERVKKFIPAIKPEYFPKRGTSGIRTPVISPEGNFVSEMIEIEGKNSFHIVNYNTPGATGAPAYSAFVVKKLQEKGILAQPKNQKDSIWNFNKIFG